MSRYGYGYGYGFGGWAPYVPVAVRRQRALRKMDALRKKGVDVQPVKIDGRKIAKSFWGQSWCDHLESFSDYENRLPRGRTYVRNGSVCHLAIDKGHVQAKVSGSELYDVKVTIKTLPSAKWTSLKGRCSGRIASLLELLQGRLSDHVMEVVTHRAEGLFPLPGEISFKCSCPDSASMCKHIAAVLYGVGARLDAKPELLFALRGVNHEELIAADAEKAVTAATTRGKSKRLAETELSEVFGIDLAAEPTVSPPETTSDDRAPTSATKKRTSSRKRIPRRVTVAAPPVAAKPAPKRKGEPAKMTKRSVAARKKVANKATTAKKKPATGAQARGKRKLLSPTAVPTLQSEPSASQAEGQSVSDTGQSTREKPTKRIRHPAKRL